MMEGCGKCMKYSLFLANLLILIGGIVVLGIGSWTLADKAFMTNVVGNNLYLSSTYILIGTGILIILLTFFGCVGAIREVKCLLLTYALLLLLLFIVLLIGGTLGYVFRNKVEESLKYEMYGSIMFYGPDNAEVTQSWDAIQLQFECCGVEEQGYRDWSEMAGNAAFIKGPDKVPASCCKKRADNTLANCTLNPQDPTTTNHVGCLSSTMIFAKQHAGVLGGVGVGIAFLMLLGICFSIALFKLIE